MHPQEVKKVLTNAQVHRLYHVNSVATALSFIKLGGLLSRQALDVSGLSQTPQITDDTDKKHGIYNDIFFDSVDIHQRASRTNDYGPVMFVYSIDVLDSLDNFDICITRDNPIRWKDEMEYGDKYFVSHMELLFGFTKGSFQQHITIRDISKPLPFDYLEEIVIDNPGEQYSAIFNQAVDSLQQALFSIGVNIPINIRACPPECDCLRKYAQCHQGYVYHRFKTQM